MTVTGTVNARLEALLRLRVRGPSGSVVEVETVVDTGYTGALALPPVVITSLGLVQQAGGYVVLADGSSRSVDSYLAEVEWRGMWLLVVVSHLGDEALLGMKLLAGHELRVEVVSGGAVAIGPIPSRAVP